MTHTVEIILTVKGLAEQQCFDAMFSLDMTTDFLKYTLLTFTFLHFHFADAFIQSDLQLGST